MEVLNIEIGITMTYIADSILKDDFEGLAQLHDFILAILDQTWQRLFAVTWRDGALQLFSLVLSPNGVILFLQVALER